MGIDTKYKVRRFSTLARIGGAGYRQLAQLDQKRSAHYERVLAVRTKTLIGQAGFELWPGRGRPLNPYLWGFLVDYLRKELKTKELKLPPDELFLHRNVKDLLEYSSLRSWVKQRLKLCHFYYGRLLSPEVVLNSFFDAPVVTAQWQANRQSPDLVRFGLL